MLQTLRRKITSHPRFRRAKAFLNPPRFAGSRLTLKRLANLYLVRYQRARVHTKLRGYPLRLTIEATNVCNLQCPGCFTGVGEQGRKRSHMPLDLYRRLLDELGDYLLQLEFYNWGEPLLAKDIYTMIEEASGRGISTVVSTNFSIPFDAARAERMVSSGLAVLGVSIDGARQQSYEQYRVRGDLDTVLANCRLMKEAKEKLGSTTPNVVWEFHTFSHNTDDIELARSMAKELGMGIVVSKGWVAGPDWETDDKELMRSITPPPYRPVPCDFLWERAVVNNDGGVAPCCGTFYRQDDMGRLKISATDIGKSSFKEVWNNWSYQQARGFFRSRTGSEQTKKMVCFDCPATTIWERYQSHLGAGGDAEAFDSEHSMNDGFNYFFSRRPAKSGPAKAAGVIELQEVGAASPQASSRR